MRDFVVGCGRHCCGGAIGSGGFLFTHCPGFSLGRCGFASGGGFSSTCICVGAAAPLLLSVDADATFDDLAVIAALLVGASLGACDGTAFCNLVPMAALGMPAGF